MDKKYEKKQNICIRILNLQRAIQYAEVKDGINL